MVNLTIDVYCRDGSPLKITPPIIWGRGVGGAELSMMTWAQTMASRGHTVRIYNNPDTPGDYDGVAYLPQSDFNPDDKTRDVFIAWRSPPHHNISHIKARAMKIHWSTDQYTVGNYATDIVPFVDKIVCISPYHLEDYVKRYNPALDKVTQIDLGVRIEDYPLEVEKIKNRFIFCSVPERGLKVIRLIWPHIRAALPDATLVITSDHRLWGAHSPNNHHYRLELLGQEGVVFLGSIERRELIELQSQAQVHLYPCTYEELFCISAAECQVAGALPVTPDIGAVKTTNKWGVILPGDARDPHWQKEYIALVLGIMSDQDRLKQLQAEAMKGARTRFDWQKICERWEGVMGVSRKVKAKYRRTKGDVEWRQ